MRCVSGLEKIGAPVRRYHDGISSGPVAVADRLSRDLKTVNSEIDDFSRVDDIFGGGSTYCCMVEIDE